MPEPYYSEFVHLLRLGAGVCDIHDSAEPVGFARHGQATPSFAARELARVEQHRHSTCRLLEAFATPAPSVLEVGCSTGALTVAMATSDALSADRLVGIDPDPLSLAAADVRVRGHGVARGRVSFRRVRSGSPLPFDDGEFHLVVCVSVLEFVSSARERRRLVSEMMRVTRTGGHLFVATPNPLRLREYHSRRWLGDVFRRPGFPWATPSWVLSRMLTAGDVIPVHDWVAHDALARAGLGAHRVPAWIARTMSAIHPWQKVLVRKALPG